MAIIFSPNAHAYVSTTAVTSTTACNTAVTTASEVTGIKDMKLNLQADKAEITTRGSGGWKQTGTTLIDATITFNAPWNNTDTVMGAIVTAFATKAPVFFAALDETGTTTGAQGVAGNWVVTQLSRTENLPDALTLDVELAPNSCNTYLTKS